MSGKIYTALGLMSGTSLDGVDGAVLRTDGQKIIGFGYGDTPNIAPARSSAVTHPYSQRDRVELSHATELALKWKFNGPQPNIFGHAEVILGDNHAGVIDALIPRYDLDSDAYELAIDVIGFHGQTLVHVPPSNTAQGQTLQIGNGKAIADRFKVPCVYDFRTADVKAGGQGAPLAPIYHKALCEYSNLTGNTVVLNLGGVGNFTWVGEGPLMASDTGPANGPLDSWLNDHGHDYDPDGKFSAKGRPDFDRVYRWLSTDFFQKPVPKSADRYDFDVRDDLAGMSLEDGAATLAAFCAMSVKETLTNLPEIPDQIIVCGGGRRNKTIMNMLRAELRCPVKTAEDVGWRGDFIEAEAFAYLSVRSILGLPISFPETTGAPSPMTGGRTVYPQA